MYYKQEIKHKEGEICFACSSNINKGGRLVKRKGKTRKGQKIQFLGCSRFPLCKNTCWL